MDLRRCLLDAARFSGMRLAIFALLVLGRVLVLSERGGDGGMEGEGRRDGGKEGRRDGGTEERREERREKERGSEAAPVSGSNFA